MSLESHWSFYNTKPIWDALSRPFSVPSNNPEHSDRYAEELKRNEGDNIKNVTKLKMSLE